MFAAKQQIGAVTPPSAGPEKSSNAGSWRAEAMASHEWIVKS
jgi:hypothetical protein